MTIVVRDHRGRLREVVYLLKRLLIAMTEKTIELLVAIVLSKHRDIHKPIFEFDSKLMTDAI